MLPDKLHFINFMHNSWCLTAGNYGSLITSIHIWKFRVSLRCLYCSEYRSLWTVKIATSRGAFPDVHTLTTGYLPLLTPHSQDFRDYKDRNQRGQESLAPTRVNRCRPVWSIRSMQTVIQFLQILRNKGTDLCATLSRPLNNWLPPAAAG